MRSSRRIHSLLFEPGNLVPTFPVPLPDEALQLTGHAHSNQLLVAFCRQPWAPERPSSACAVQLAPDALRGASGIGRGCRGRARDRDLETCGVLYFPLLGP